MTVSVAINGTNFGSLNENQVRALVGNAAGIDVSMQTDKITVACAPFYNSTETPTEPEDPNTQKKGISPLLIGVIAGVSLLLLLIILFVVLFVRRKNKKKAGEEEAAATIITADGAVVPKPVVNEEILAMQNDKSVELRNNVRDFTEQNSEITAQMLRNWLNGGAGDGEA